MVRKNGRLHYGIYFDGSFSGSVEFRGLAPGRYRIVDYVAGKTLGEVTVKAKGDAARLTVRFARYLLVEAVAL